MDKKEQNKSKLILYQTEDGKTRLEARLQEESVWLTQKMIVDLFQTTIPNINMHIKNILDEKELDRRATIKNFLIVQKEGSREVSRSVEHYNLEMADAKKPNMGLTPWKGAKVRRQDVAIAKNYLNEKEIEGLNRIVTMYLDYAEYQAKRHKQIFMRDWRKKLDAFLKFNEHEILDNPGKASKEVADKLALEHYEVFNQHRLAIDAKEEALVDDRELKQIQSRLEKKKRKK